MLIGYTGDVHRFRNRDQLRRLQRHRTGRVLLGRPSRAPIARGVGTADSTTRSTWPRSARSANRTPKGRAYFDRNVAEGKTKKEALRALKRHVSNAVYRQLVADAQRTRS